MKLFVSLLAVATFALAGCNNDLTKSGVSRRDSGSDRILLVHSVGSDELLKSPEAAKLREVWGLKSSGDLRNLALDRFSRLPYFWLSNALPKGSADQAAMFRPLFEDLLARESYIDWRSTPTFGLAVRMPEARAQAWDKNLRQVLSGWKLGNPTTLNAAGHSGWELAKAGVFSIRFSRAGDWNTLTVGQDTANVESNLVASTKASRLTGAWLEGDMNLAHFKGRIPWLEYYDNLPIAHFSLSNRADFVRTLVRLDFPKPHNWKSEPWQIPTNMMSDRIMDFTVVRGIAGVLDALPVVQNSGWNPVPGQVCGWGNRDLPFQFFYTLPAQNVTNRLAAMAPRLRSEVHRTLGDNLQGSVDWNPARQELMWSGLPLAVPSLFQGREGNTEFLTMGLFPLLKSKRPPPAELFEQLKGRNDLALYDWESTEFRVPSWRQLYQIAEIATHRRLSASNLVSQRWQVEVGSHLGDSVTEMRVTSPLQMTLVRKSTIGLTSFELVTLSRWLDSADFPAFGLYPPARGRPAK